MKNIYWVMDCWCFYATKSPIRGVVWCGVVWCGVVWCGVVWCGVLWCAVVWCGVVWCGVVWCGVVWCGVLSFGALASPSRLSHPLQKTIPGKKRKFTKGADFRYTNLLSASDPPNHPRGRGGGGRGCD